MHFTQLEPVFGTLSGSVTSIAKCSDGFLWFATSEGVIRFDGYAARRYTNRKEDPASLVNSRANILHIDDRQRIWIGTQMGISRYIAELDQFRNYLLDEVDLASNLSNNVHSILHDRHGVIYASSERGFIFRYHEAEDRFVRINSNSFGIIKSMAFDSQERLWIGSLGDVFRFNPRTQETKAFAGFIRHRRFHGQQFHPQHARPGGQRHSHCNFAQGCPSV
jgi:ligand-binding sensor domain-containing protein